MTSIGGMLTGFSWEIGTVLFLFEKLWILFFGVYTEGTSVGLALWFSLSLKPALNQCSKCSICAICLRLGDTDLTLVTRRRKKISHFYQYNYFWPKTKDFEGLGFLKGIISCWKTGETILKYFNIRINV